MSMSMIEYRSINTVQSIPFNQSRYSSINSIIHAEAFPSLPSPLHLTPHNHPPNQHPSIHIMRTMKYQDHFKLRLNSNQLNSTQLNSFAHSHNTHALLTSGIPYITALSPKAHHMSIISSSIQRQSGQVGRVSSTPIP